MAVFNEQLPKFLKMYQLALASWPHTPRGSVLAVDLCVAGTRGTSSALSGAVPVGSRAFRPTCVLPVGLHRQ